VAFSFASNYSNVEVQLAIKRNYCAEKVFRTGIPQLQFTFCVISVSARYCSTADATYVCR
jgi:hypothetical protein